MIHVPKHWSRVGAFGCGHLWFGETLDAPLERMAKANIDCFVYLGDSMDADAASRHPMEKRKSLRDEFAIVNSGLARIRESIQRRRRTKVKFVFMSGNHEANLSEDLRIDPSLRDMCDMRDNMPELRHWELHPYVYDHRGVFSYGQARFFHGYETSEAGLRSQAVQLGVYNGISVSAHTHRPTHAIRRIHLTPTGAFTGYSWFDVGTHGPLKPPYTKRWKTVNWGQSACIIHLDPNITGPHQSQEWELEPIHCPRSYRKEVA